MLPVDQKDYELQIGADGNLFRLVRKNTVDQMDSPILYRENGGKYRINPTFTLIDGKVVVAY